MNKQDNSDTDLDLAIDGILYALDFRVWFGRSTFNSVLAEVIRRHYSGKPASSLLDVLESVTLSYAGEVADAFNSEGSKLSQNDFYRYIHHVRCGSDSVEWENFFQQLLRRITGSCERLRQKDTPERNTQRTRSRQNYEGIEPQSAEEDTRPSSANSSASSASSGSPSARPSRGAFYGSVRPTTSPSQKDKSKYSMAIQEYFHVNPGKPTCHFVRVRVEPSVWRCTLDMGGDLVSGLGCKKQEAKHAASERLCSLLGIAVD